MKFKIGDKVRLNKNKEFFYYSRVGVSYDEIGTIKEIDTINTDEYIVEFPSHSCWRGKEDELELVTTTFKKSDLKDGDIVIQRDGGKKRYCTNREGFVGIDDDSYLAYSNYKENLLDKDGDEIYDIVKVERPKYETVFERKEEILDNTEKNYLRGVTRPFRDRVKYIQKFTFSTGKEKITIKTEKDNDTWYIGLPPFEKDAMYKNMKSDKKYTLEELGL